MDLKQLSITILGLYKMNERIVIIVPFVPYVVCFVILRRGKTRGIRFSIVFRPDDLSSQCRLWKSWFCHCQRSCRAKGGGSEEAVADTKTSEWRQGIAWSSE
jgi:hypothetical protein